MPTKETMDSEVASFVADIKENAARCGIDTGEFAAFLAPMLEQGRESELLELTACSLALAFELSIQTAVIEREHYRALAEMQQAAEEAGYEPMYSRVEHDLGSESLYRRPSEDKSIARLL